MENEFWLNLSSKDLPRAKEFFVKLGFTMNECHQAHHMVSMFIGNKKTVLNLFTEDLFKGSLAVTQLQIPANRTKFYFLLERVHRKRWMT